MIHFLGYFSGCVIVVSIVVFIGWIIGKIIKSIFFKKRTTDTQKQNNYFQTYFKIDISVILSISFIMTLIHLAKEGGAISLIQQLKFMLLPYLLLLFFVIYREIRR
ncbi:hypothetical protein [Campylobacter cuniculorum]|uniref:hypothetical protein n=1 Tax=Campylobacter cuniculorum TaxID=374106 RepID=UPI0023F3CB46|nr:hypothetical protein [Campylobacter cuniculorum]